MLHLIFNMLLAFGEGLALIVSPCILPILPIVLSGSLTGSKRRPLGIIFGFILSFTLLTLFAHQLLSVLPLSAEIIRYFSIAILIMLSIIMLSETLTERFGIFTANLSNVGSSASFSQPDFWSGAFFGVLIGILWTPCAGPILAAVIVQIAIQQTSTYSVFILIAFSIGVGVPMLLIALLGRRVLKFFHFNPRSLIIIRKLLGLIILVSVLLMIYMPEEAIPEKLDNPPSNIEQQTKQLTHGLLIPYQPPEINVTSWINSPPLKLHDLKGKVVLIDFWTYSCINCIRTLPYLKKWYDNYHDEGLIIIGVHSPEFAFEHDYNNVLAAVKRYKLNYPIALDNEFRTWRAFNNHYWPAHYLINKDNKVVYTHFGEGNYDITENNIRYLLGSRKQKNKSESTANFNQEQTPEIYFGNARADHYQGQPPLKRGHTQNYSLQDSLAKNAWGLQGKWLIQNEYIEAMEKKASVRLNFTAAKVYAVLGSANGPKVVTIHINGNEIKKFTVEKHELYILIDSPTVNSNTIDLIAQSPGLQLYTFTFGQ